MGTNHCPLAVRLLEEIQRAQAALIAHSTANGPLRQALTAVHAALAAGVADLDEAVLLTAPSPDEWSMAEVLQHVAEHDGRYEEYRRLGLDHYVEHGLEHALHLWRLRAGTLATVADGRTG